MKIAVDLTSLSYHMTGIERYAMCVTDQLIDYDESNVYYLIFRNEIHSVFANRIDGKRINAVVIVGENKLKFLQVTLRHALKEIQADKYLFFAYPGPFLFNKKGIINTIHDMGAWDSANEAQTLNKYYFRASYKYAAKVSEKVITVSEFSKSRINSILHIPEEKVVVIYSAVYDSFLNGDEVPFDIIKSEYNLPNRYIMTLSTIEPRKNMSILLEAFDSIADKTDYDLVLVGRKGWKMDGILAKYNEKGRIHLTGFVKDEHLSSVYKNAMCFVFPSLYEGFGLPPVEALALGVPVISSDAASLPEVLQNQAVYFKNNSVEELKNLLVNIETILPQMPHELNQYQKETYSFLTAAKKVFQLL